MKAKAILSLIALVFTLSSFATTPGDIDKVTLNNIRTEVSDLLNDVDKETVDNGQEEVRICFSVDEAGEVTVYSVLSASADLKKEIIEKMHHAVLESGTTEGEAVWMTATIEAYK
jgi:hypothetical protein